MKSNNILGTVYLAIALGLIVLLSTGLRGKLDSRLSHFFPTAPDRDWDDEQSGAAANADFTKGEVHTVEIELQSLSLKIGRSNDEKVHLELAGTAMQACKFSNRSGKLSVKEHWKKTGDGKVIVSLPASWQGDLELESVSGSVNIQDVNPDSMDIESVSGSVLLKNCNSSKLEVEAVSGSVKADGAFEKVRVETVSGSITVTTSSPLKHKSNFESLSGAITLGMPRNAGYALHFDSMSGSFTDEITGTNGKKKVDSVNGDGKVSISASTLSGAMKVQQSN